MMSNQLLLNDHNSNSNNNKLVLAMEPEIERAEPELSFNLWLHPFQFLALYGSMARTIINQPEKSVECYKKSADAMNSIENLHFSEIRSSLDKKSHSFND